jgi:rsbT co-antagonist protein RsbR
MNNQSFKFLQKTKKQLLDTWMSNQLEDQSLREDLLSNDDLRAQSDELLTALLKTLLTDNIEDTESKDFEKVSGILSDISASRARQGFSARETALFVLSLKEALNQAVQKEFADDHKRLFESVSAISKLLDKLTIVTFETFIKGREEVIIRQTDEIGEISTPVIRVWEGVVALPIIGTLDSMRTQVVMENLLQEIVTTGSTIAILDISGVPAVDSLVAQHLLKTVSATRLMGAECIISGIRPEIAQTIVHLGIDLSHIKTKASLASALKLAFSMLNLEVKKTEKTRLSNG